MNKMQLFFTMFSLLIVGSAIYDPIGFMGAAFFVMVSVVGVIVVVAVIAVFLHMYTSLGEP